MDFKHKESKSNLKKNFIEKEKNLNFNLNSINTKKSIKKIKFPQNRRYAFSTYDDKDIEINKDYVYKFLKKFPTSRNVQDIKNVAEYLSKNYQYFSKVKKEQGISKLEFITKICH